MGRAISIGRIRAIAFCAERQRRSTGGYLSIKFFLRIIVFLPIASFCSSLSAQQTAPPPSSEPSGQQQTQPAPPQPQPSSAQEPSKPRPSGQKDTSGTSKDRLFYTLPNFLTLENGGKVPPLTAKQKFAVVARGTFDPVQYPWWGLLSAISQAENSEPAFGQGWAAYGKRYGTTAADSTIENFMVGAVFPSLLHQDPRFFQSGEGGFGRRTWYSITRIFVTRSDSGHVQFNYSEIFGSATAAAISTYTYHPRSTYLSTPSNPHRFVGSDRTLVNAGDVWATQLTLDTVTIAVKEFWPDIHRKLSHKNKIAEPAAISPSPQP
jgi:hypothetical protein